MPFDGVTYEAEKDRARLAQQLGHVRDLMLDGAARTLAEISNALFNTKGIRFPEASVSARLRDLRKPKFGGYIVARERIGRGIFTYQITGQQGAEFVPTPREHPVPPRRLKPSQLRTPLTNAAIVEYTQIATLYKRTRELVDAAVSISASVEEHCARGGSFCAPGSRIHADGDTEPCRTAIERFDALLAAWIQSFPEVNDPEAGLRALR